MVRTVVFALSLVVAAPASAQYVDLVADVFPGIGGSASDAEFFDWNGEAVFAAYTAAEGFEPWISDGTAAGTRRVADVFPGPGSGVLPWRAPVAVGSAFYFAADDGVHGVELWRSDGTPGGTSLAVDLEPGPGSSDPRVLAFGNVLVVRAFTSLHGFELWIGDGTPGGTQVLDLNPGPANGTALVPTAFASSFLFVADDGVHGIEPWISDGTVAGTRMLRDVAPGPASSAAMNVVTFRSLGHRVVFRVDDGVHGWEPWSTDGTLAGTQLVADLHPGAASSYPDFLNAADVATGVAFRASTPLGFEPWVTDGTPAGTRLLGDLAPGPASSNAIPLAASNGRAALIAHTPATGLEPWVTDGTPAGTVPAEIVPGPASGVSAAHGVASAAGRAWFVTVTPQWGLELGTSDGTVAGTRAIEDLDPTGTLAIGKLLPIDGMLLFRRGSRLAYSGGTPETTDFAPLAPTLPEDPVLDHPARIGNRVFLLGEAPSSGTEPYSFEFDGDGDGVPSYLDAANLEVGCTCPAAVAPCGNPDASAGCASSLGVGARIDGSGTTRLSEDDLVLTISSLPPFVNALFLGGGTVAPAPFSDGVRCVASPTVRFPVANAGASGTIAYGPDLAAFVESRFPAALHFSPGATWHFQGWFRDGAGPCGQGANLSSSIEAIFTP